MNVKILTHYPSINKPQFSYPIQERLLFVKNSTKPCLAVETAQLSFDKVEKAFCSRNRYAFDVVMEKAFLR